LHRQWKNEASAAPRARHLIRDVRISTTPGVRDDGTVTIWEPLCRRRRAMRKVGSPSFSAKGLEGAVGVPAL